MKTGSSFKPLIVIATVIFLFSKAAIGAENGSPYLPGATTGTPIGALPPPGVYVTDDVYVAKGKTLRGADGSGTPLTVQNIANAPIFLWVPGVRVLGAQYAANFVQLYAEHDVDTTALGGKSTKTAGIFNTIVAPMILSWDLGDGLFTSLGVELYIPNGHYRYENGKVAQTSYANNFWTVEPNFAVTYLKNNWNFTLNNIFDISRTNPSTNYRSGNAYYLDATAAKTIGPWTTGLIANYSRQIADDYQNGSVVGNGNRFEHILLGPLLSYDFGSAKLSLRYLRNVRTRNDVDVSFLHVSVSFKL